MIAPMQKVTVLGCTAWQDQLLSTIQSLGFVHIMPFVPDNKAIREDDLAEVKENIHLLETAIHLIPDNAAASPYASDANGLAYAKQLLALYENQKNLHKEIKNLEDEYKALGIWGGSALAPEQLEIFNEKGLALHFYLATAQDLDKIPPTTCIYQIGHAGGRHLLVTITYDRDRTAGLDKALDELQEVAPPSRGMEEIATLLAEKKKAQSIGDRQMKTLKQIPALSQSLSQQQERLAFIEARRAMGTGHDICHLSGFCPCSSLPDLRTAARRQRWGLLLEEPLENDPVPTLIQYSRWSSIFRPVMDFMGVIPAYREFDCNGPSLFFFIIFFAMLIGDAGYGLILFITSLFFLHQGRSQREPFFLLIILAAATMLWGAFTGAWFGLEGLEHTPLGLMILPSLAASAPQNTASVMQICFSIGAIQLALAHLWLTARKLPNLVAVADIGWVLIIGALYFISLFLVLNKPMPPLTFLLLSSGAALVVLFSEQSETFSVGAIAKALAHSPLTLLSGVSSLSDLISYIRLFAVGLATREVALAVNHMALNMGFETILTSLAAVAILLTGHGLNIILGAMAILVHGVRLNLLEFSRHLGISWSGIPYAPFGAHTKT